ncbi:hypothetical protein DLAC_01876 [Tieghemostelium lacteum]|uniref:Methyltransferase small domain-containing protein n=1 Tax=Tieghemostelium lacteum TaxID=361077 RepID=A0A152A6L0_TIELA|nr:hypothetical protein DLAC_01876 [Tieghemostelium lacteum]|eukprot:KYR01859.1 hypothetical protein DLAC_01876 [Tieghemostelium lacteum]
MTDNNNNNNEIIVEKKKRNKGIFIFKQFTVNHEICAQKVGSDALLLAGYTAIGKSVEYEQLVWSGKVYDYDYGIGGEILNKGLEDGQWPRHVLDIGTGCGVLSLMLAQRFKQSIINSIDIDESAIQQTTMNIDNIYKEHPENVTKNMYLFHTPIQEFQPTLTVPCELEKNKHVHRERKDMAPAIDDRYDLIISAPPYFKSDITIDQQVSAMKTNRRIARHTHTLSMKDLVQSVVRLLKPDTGIFTTIVSIPYPSDDLEEEALKQGLVLLELVLVTDTPDSKVVRKMYKFYLPSQPQPNQPPPTQRNFPIYETSIKDSNLKTHRKHSNQYKWMLNDFCNHFNKEKDLLLP